MVDLACILAESLPTPYMDTMPMSSTQTDVQRNKHPQSVQLWDAFDGEVQKHKNSKKKAEPRFRSNQLVG